MLELNISDTLNVLESCLPYLIGFAVVLVIALAVMIGCRGLNRAKKFLCRSQAGVAIVLAFAIAANLICLGPMSSIITLATGGGQVSEETTREVISLGEKISRKALCF